MDQLLIFIGNHTILAAGIAVVSLMLIHNLLGDRLRGFQSVNPAQSTQLINKDDAVILDVRENNEHRNGHIINSVHIPLSNLKTRLNELDKYKQQNVIIACRSGHRSAQACANLKKAGFEKIFNLSGGIMAWENANLPLIKK